MTTQASGCSLSWEQPRLTRVLSFCCTRILKLKRCDVARCNRPSNWRCLLLLGLDGVRAKTERSYICLGHLYCGVRFGDIPCVLGRLPDLTCRKAPVPGVISTKRLNDKLSPLQPPKKTRKPTNSSSYIRFLNRAPGQASTTLVAWQSNLRLRRHVTPDSTDSNQSLSQIRMSHRRGQIPTRQLSDTGTS